MVRCCPVVYYIFVKWFVCVVWFEYLGMLWYHIIEFTNTILQITIYINIYIPYSYTIDILSRIYNKDHFTIGYHWRSVIINYAGQRASCLFTINRSVNDWWNIIACANYSCSEIFKLKRHYGIVMLPFKNSRRYNVDSDLLYYSS